MVKLAFKRFIFKWFFQSGLQIRISYIAEGLEYISYVAGRVVVHMLQPFLRKQSPRQNYSLAVVRMQIPHDHAFPFARYVFANLHGMDQLFVALRCNYTSDVVCAYMYL